MSAYREFDLNAGAHSRTRREGSTDLSHAYLIDPANGNIIVRQRHNTSPSVEFLKANMVVNRHHGPAPSKQNLGTTTTKLMDGIYSCDVQQ